MSINPIASSLYIEPSVPPKELEESNNVAMTGVSREERGKSIQYLENHKIKDYGTILEGVKDLRRELLIGLVAISIIASVGTVMIISLSSAGIIGGVATKVSLLTLNVNVGLPIGLVLSCKFLRSTGYEEKQKWVLKFAIEKLFRTCENFQIPLSAITESNKVAFLKSEILTLKTIIMSHRRNLNEYENAVTDKTVIEEIEKWNLKQLLLQAEEKLNKSFLELNQVANLVTLIA